jgi:hypothetical protein
MSEPLTDFQQYSLTLGDNFWANPVTGEQNNLSLQRKSTFLAKYNCHTWSTHFTERRLLRKVSVRRKQEILVQIALKRLI